MFVPIGSNSGESYQVQRSQRFRKSASAYASRTPGSAGNRKLTHFRDRIKRGELGTLQVIYSAGTSSIDCLYFDTSNRLCLDVLGTTRLVSTQVFRDPTAFTIDVGFQLDVANGTAAQRAKLMVDGVEVSAYSTDSRASITNTDTNWNNTVVHYLGRDNSGNYFDGYMAEPISVDGSLSSNYITTDASFGQLVASRPSATYGTQGWFLDFSDPTSLTTLGYDRSGNANNFTLTNISLTAGVTYDSMTDVPLAYGTTDRGNFATLNPLCPASANTAPPTNGNLTAVPTVSTQVNTFANQPLPLSGKWYWEVDCSNPATFGITVGLRASITSATLASVVDGYCYYNATGNKILGTIDTAYGTSWFVTGATNIGVGYDAGTGQLSFYLNGVSQGVAATLSTSVQYFPAGSHESGSGSHTENWNFGQRPFTYTPPTGFKALHTGNLTNTTVVTSGSYTGNLSADGPCIWCNGTPETLTINGNAVTWGTHADKLATGFKIRTASSSYNSSGTNTWTATFPSPSSQAAFKYQNAKGNP